MTIHCDGYIRIHYHGVTRPWPATENRSKKPSGRSARPLRMEARKEVPPMRRNERGMALLLCILSLMLLTVIAAGMIYMTDSETMVNNNYRSSQQAYFAAMAGLQ